MSRRPHGLRLLAFLLATLLGATAHASFHEMQIEQVVGGVNGDTSVQAIQLRMRFTGENLVSGAKLIARDAAGANPVTLITFPGNATNSNGRILAATANFAAHTDTNLAPDFTLTNTIPASYLPAGRLDYTSSTGAVLWSIIYGGNGYTGSTTTSDTTNDADGQFGPAYQGPLPSTGRDALLLSLNASDGSRSSSLDYALTTTAASFTNNAPNSGQLLAPSTNLPDIVKGKTRLALQTVASGLVSPVEAMGAGDGSGRLFIVDQSGFIRLIKNGALVASPFLDLKSRLVNLSTTYDERGFLGLAFHPGFATASSAGFRRLYTYTSEPRASGTTDFPGTGQNLPNHHGVIAEWQVFANDPDHVDVSSRREVLRFDHPQSNHNGGQLAFRPSDGLLYIGIGDGGSANDQGDGHPAATGNGQILTTLLGKILRINPIPRADPITGPANNQYQYQSTIPFTGAGELREIYAYGFRNPYRFSFDSAPGVDRLIVADVGQNHIEEVDIVEIGKNYGWRQKEGTFLFTPNTAGDIAFDPAPDPNLIDPVLQYDHDDGISVLGGFVYRGAALPGLLGKYIYSDFSRTFQTPSGRLFVGDLSARTIEEIRVAVGTQPSSLFLKGMGRDDAGEVYLLGSTALAPAAPAGAGPAGVVLKLVPIPDLIAVGAGVGAAPRVRVLEGSGIQVKSFLARATTFRGGIPVAVGDVNGDGTPDVITGVGRGGGPGVRVFDGISGATLANFLAFDASFRGGVYVAAGDTNGDGTAEIIVGAGPGSTPTVKIFPGLGGAALATFDAYDASFRGGVRVAAADVDGDRSAEIVTGPGANTGPNVRVFNAAGTMQKSFFAYDANFRGGVFVAAADVNGDGRADIITGPGAGSPPTVKAFNVADLAVLKELTAYSAAFRGGVHVGVADVTGSGDVRILTAPASGGSSTVRFFDPATGLMTRQFPAFNSGAGAGPFVTGRGN